LDTLERNAASSSSPSSLSPPSTSEYNLKSVLKKRPSDEILHSLREFYLQSKSRSTSDLVLVATPARSGSPATASNSRESEILSSSGLTSTLSSSYSSSSSTAAGMSDSLPRSTLTSSTPIPHDNVNSKMSSPQPIKRAAFFLFEPMSPEESIPPLLISKKKKETKKSIRFNHAVEQRACVEETEEEEVDCGGGGDEK